MMSPASEDNNELGSGALRDLLQDLQEHRRAVFPPERNGAPGDQTDAERAGVRVLEEGVQSVFSDGALPPDALQGRPRQELHQQHVGLGKARLQVQVQSVLAGVQDAGEAATALAVPHDQGRHQVRTVREEFQVAGGAAQARGERPLGLDRRRTDGVQAELDEQSPASGGAARTSAGQLHQRYFKEGISGRGGRGDRVRRQQRDQHQPRRQQSKRRRELGRQHHLQRPTVPRRLPEQSSDRGGQLQRSQQEVQVSPVQSRLHQTELLDGSQQNSFASKGREAELPNGKVPGPK
jgi:hypothetical protein